MGIFKKSASAAPDVASIAKACGSQGCATVCTCISCTGRQRSDAVGMAQRSRASIKVRMHLLDGRQSLSGRSKR